MNVQEVRLRNFTPEDSLVPFSPNRGWFRQRAGAVVETAAAAPRVRSAPGLPIS
jgi:hypothetical protein